MPSHEFHVRGLATHDIHNYGGAVQGDGVGQSAESSPCRVW